jgi:hypothetical protein
MDIPSLTDNHSLILPYHLVDVFLLDTGENLVNTQAALAQVHNQTPSLCFFASFSSPSFPSVFVGHDGFVPSVVKTGLV